MLMGSNTAGKILQKVDNQLRGDIWGGVGVVCMDWSTLQPNLLAAVTFKTNQLEIWDTETGNLIKQFYFDNRVIKVSWCPTSKDHLVILTDEHEGIILNYVSGTNVLVNVPGITAIIWHPRTAGYLIVGKHTGQVYLFDWLKCIRKIEYQIPFEKLNEETKSQ